MSLEGEVYEIITPPASFSQVAETLEAQSIETEVAELTRVPSTSVDLDKRDARKLLKLLEALEDNDDVQSVTANFNIPDAIMEAVMAEA